MLQWLAMAIMAELGFQDEVNTGAETDQFQASNEKVNFG